MARMLGRQVWYGVACTCCNGPRAVKVERTREKRALARELLPERARENMDGEDGDCLHGCNGGCVYGGSERCTFVCHELTPEIEALFDRLDRRAMEIMGEVLVDWPRV